MEPKNKHPQTVNIMYQESAIERVPIRNQIETPRRIKLRRGED